MSFISNILQYSPTFLLNFNRKLTGKIENLGVVNVSHEYVGGASVADLTNPIIPSRGNYGGGVEFLSNPGNTEIGSSAYRVLAQSGQAYRPTSAITLIVACNSPAYRRYGGFLSNTQSGGWAIEIASITNTVGFAVNVNGAYLRASPPLDFYLNPKNNLLIATYDGRYARLYHNGVLIAENDAGGNYPIQYSSTVYHITIGCEVGSGINISDFIGLPVEVAAMIPNQALSQEQIESLYSDFATQKHLSGNLKQDNLKVGKCVRVRPWYNDNPTKKETASAALDVTPDVNGDWDIVVPDGKYEVVLIGDDGFAPKAHGPVLAG